MPDSTLDSAALASSDAQRVALLVIDRELQALRRAFDEGRTLDAHDRARLATIETNVQTLMEAQQSWFARIIAQAGRIDKARRPWFYLFVLVLAVAVGLGVVGAGAWWAWYTSDAQEAKRTNAEAARQRIECVQAGLTPECAARMPHLAPPDTALNVP